MNSLARMLAIFDLFDGDHRLPDCHGTGLKMPETKDYPN